VHCIQWLDTQEKPNSGSLLSVAWSLDGTQIAGVGGNGTILFGQLVHR
jgi:intraflagellar transport protein 80